MSDAQQMMHGPLTIAQADRARRINARSSPALMGCGERIVRIVDTWPPLTEEQLAHLAILLLP